MSSAYRAVAAKEIPDRRQGSEQQVTGKNANVNKLCGPALLQTFLALPRRGGRNGQLPRGLAVKKKNWSQSAPLRCLPVPSQLFRTSENAIFLPDLPVLLPLIMLPLEKLKPIRYIGPMSRAHQTDGSLPIPPNSMEARRVREG